MTKIKNDAMTRRYRAGNATTSVAQRPAGLVFPFDCMNSFMPPWAPSLIFFPSAESAASPVFVESSLQPLTDARAIATPTSVTEKIRSDFMFSMATTPDDDRMKTQAVWAHSAILAEALRPAARIGTRAPLSRLRDANTENNHFSPTNNARIDQTK
jgi:hypothetical protein